MNCFCRPNIINRWISFDGSWRRFNYWITSLCFCFIRHHERRGWKHKMLFIVFSARNWFPICTLHASRSIELVKHLQAIKRVSYDQDIELDTRINRRSEAEEEHILMSHLVVKNLLRLFWGNFSSSNFLRFSSFGSNDPCISVSGVKLGEIWSLIHEVSADNWWVFLPRFQFWFLRRGVRFIVWNATAVLWDWDTWENKGFVHEPRRNEICIRCQ